MAICIWKEVSYELLQSELNSEQIKQHCMRKSYWLKAEAIIPLTHSCFLLLFSFVGFDYEVVGGHHVYIDLPYLYSNYLFFFSFLIPISLMLMFYLSYKKDTRLLHFRFSVLYIWELEKPIFKNRSGQIGKGISLWFTGLIMIELKLNWK